MEEKKIISIPSVAAMPCNWSVGKVVDRFLDGLVEGKIMGIKCGKCGKVYVPPRLLCADCFQEMSEWTEVAGQGEIINYTVAHVDQRNNRIGSPRVLGMIKLDGSHTSLFGEIKGLEPGPGLIGKRVKAVFREERKGNIRDITCYEPV